MQRKFILPLLALLFYSISSFSQSTNQYEISFDNAAHHEAEITVVFPNLSHKILKVRMSRSSPGRYALHEFAKNVYNVKAFDSKGEPLEIYRPNPYQWNIAGHDGEVKVTYTLFADQADGTYSAIDITHAHLNIPATFMYAKGLGYRPIEVTFNVRKDLNWKVATQMKKVGQYTYYAPDTQYFMDSPVEISDFSLREWTEESNGKEYTIRLVIHHLGTEEEVDQYVEMVKAIVKEEEAVYGGLPDYDFGTYTFLACYTPYVDGDGMEHRNSTVLTSSRPLSTSALRNVGTVSHEFFHGWNVERVRPASLEPFNFAKTNMSGALWFAEGFTSYYTNLILTRTGIISREQYIQSLAGTLNYVINSPGHQFFSPVEMSYQAPFVDAATSVDPNNRGNTFISYYSYGSVLALALDLELRNRFDDLTLDTFMRAAWKTFGKPEQPYTIPELEELLAKHTGDKEFAHTFFDKYITNSKMPDFQNLLANLGVELTLASPDSVDFDGTRLSFDQGVPVVASTVFVGTNLYKAGIDQGDIILSFDGQLITSKEGFMAFLANHKPGQEIELKYLQRGHEKTATLELTESKRLATTLIEEPGKKEENFLDSWLGSNVKKEE